MHGCDDDAIIITQMMGFGNCIPILYKRIMILSDEEAERNDSHGASKKKKRATN